MAVVGKRQTEGFWCWDTLTGAEVSRSAIKAEEFPAHDLPDTVFGTLAFGWSPDRKRVAIVRNDGTVGAFLSGRFEKPEAVFEGTGHVTEYTLIKFSPDGGRIVAGTQGGDVPLWDSKTGKKAVSLKHGGAVRVAEFSTDGTRLLSAGDGLTIRIWGPQTGRAVFVLQHSGPTATTAFSPDGKRIMAVTLDGAVSLWDAQPGVRLLTLTDQTGPIVSAGFGRGGQQLLAVNSAGRITTWDAAPVAVVPERLAPPDGFARPSDDPFGFPPKP